MKNRILLAFIASISCAHGADDPIDADVYDYFTKAPLLQNVKDLDGCFVARPTHGSGTCPTYHAEALFGYLDGHQGTLWVDPRMNVHITEVVVYYGNLVGGKVQKIATINYNQRAAVLAAMPELRCVTENSAWNQALYDTVHQKYATINAQRLDRFERAMAQVTSALATLKQ